MLSSSRGEAKFWLCWFWLIGWLFSLNERVLPQYYIGVDSDEDTYWEGKLVMVVNGVVEPQKNEVQHIIQKTIARAK